jgi:hypothetical protein
MLTWDVPWVQDLVRHIHNLLWLMVVLNFSDGLQCVLTGVIQVCHLLKPPMQWGVA